MSASLLSKGDAAWTAAGQQRRMPWLAAIIGALGGTRLAGAGLEASAAPVRCAALLF
jgi:hypothetical protein